MAKADTHFLMLSQYAGVMGMREDLGLVGNQFANNTTALFSAALCAQFPLGE
jgi:hypothetical protein